MDPLYCRNPSCRYFRTPFPDFPAVCPEDGWPVMGSVIESTGYVDPMADLPTPEEPWSAPVPPPRSEAPPRSATQPARPLAPDDFPVAGPLRGLVDRGRDVVRKIVRPPEEGRRRAGSAPEKAPPRPVARPGPRPADLGDQSPATVIEQPRPIARSGQKYGRFQFRNLDDDGWAPLVFEGACRKSINRRQVGPGGGQGQPRSLVDLRNTRRGLVVTPGDTINGVYRKIASSAQIRSGGRFRIGHYVIEYHAASGEEPITPLVRDGERFQARDLVTDRLVFIRPDGSPGMSIAFVRPLVFGRGGGDGRPVDVPLEGDDISRQHVRALPSPGGLTLEDLGSTNGTFLQIISEATITGDAVLKLMGDVRFQIERLD